MSSPSFLSQFFSNGALQFSGPGQPATAVTSDDIDAAINADAQAQAQLNLSNQTQSLGQGVVQTPVSNTLSVSGTATLPVGSANLYLSVAVVNASGDTVASLSTIVTESDEQSGSKDFAIGGSTGETDATTLSVYCALTIDTGISSLSWFTPVPQISANLEVLEVNNGNN
jgi:hypothetical protein